MKPIVLVSRELPLSPVEVAGEAVEFRVAAPDEPLSDSARVYLSTALDVVDADLIARMPDTIGLIANLGVGVDNIDLDAAAARSIAVSNTPVVTEDTADLAFALILGACRRIGVNERFLRAGEWTDSVPLAAMGSRVHGKTLGIIGFGAIGQAVAQRATGFNMPVLYTSRSRKPELEANLNARFVATAEALVAEADIVSLHTPLTPDTHKLVDAELLAHFKPGAALINTGRGPLVDDTALAAALASGHISTAGLDVFDGEPHVASELLAHNNALLTPHIGSATAECRTEIVRRGLANIVTFLETDSPLDNVTTE